MGRERMGHLHLGLDNVEQLKLLYDLRDDATHELKSCTNS